MAKVTWYGTGLMGAGFVEALCRRGDEVVVHNRTIDKARALERFGARAESDPRAAAQGADRLHFSLSDDDAVDALLETLAGGIDAQTVVVDHTTVAPEPTKRRFDRCAKHGIAFVHAPVFMSPQACRESKGVMLVSGPAAVIERVRAELEKMTGDLWLLGDRPDKAAVLKLCGNQMIMFIIAGLADVYAFAGGAGIAPAEAQELFEHFKPGLQIDMRGKKMSSGDFTAMFELTMARKDIRLMLETASASATALHVLPAIAQRFDDVLAQGRGKQDVGVIAYDAVTSFLPRGS